MSKAPFSQSQPALSPELFDEAFLNRLSVGLKLACEWLSGVAQVCGEEPGQECDTGEFPYRDWSGAIKGEYSAKTRRWGFFCPYWHTGQALKALLMAEPLLGYPSAIREAAHRAGEFLFRNRIVGEGESEGDLLLAYEDTPYTVNTSAILETIDGLFLAADLLCAPQYEEAALRGLRWVATRAFEKEHGLFKNSYDPVARQFVVLPAFARFAPEYRSRPLLDDAVFLKGYQRSGCEEFKAIFYATAERLLKEEEPAGNWVRFSPCHPPTGRIHPRHAYWWGGPMLDAWLESGDERYRDCFHRALLWYAKTMRKDGGYIRGTYRDGGTDSFGHATSGSACASILFIRAATELGDASFLPQAKLSLEHCMQLQFRAPQDPNLRGAILEKVHLPDGTDASPYHLRDLSTIFFIQAASYCLSAAMGEEVKEARKLV